MLFVKTHPLAGLHVSVVHTLLSLQTTAAPDRQAPPLHVSPAVHALPSVHADVLLVKTHPVAGLHVSVVHTLPSLHTTAGPALQVPPPQVSPEVQALPSLQAMVLFVNTQPVASVHVSVVQGLLSLHTMPTPAHTPPLQTSPEVQAFASSQASVLLVKTHPLAGLHVSVVHTLLSLQTTAEPALHVPPPQVSPVVHAFPSSQAFVLLMKAQPDAGLHVSVVQTLLSLQTIAAPA